MSSPYLVTCLVCGKAIRWANPAVAPIGGVGPCCRDKPRCRVNPKWNAPHILALCHVQEQTP